LKSIWLQALKHTVLSKCSFLELFYYMLLYRHCYCLLIYIYISWYKHPLY
jgi:hypothetical protein